MKKSMYYIIFGIVLTIGIAIIAWGSFLILDRYELQSMNIEELKTGILPSAIMLIGSRKEVFLKECFISFL